MTNNIRDIKDIIDLLQEDAIRASIETNIYPSVYLGVAIYEFRKYGDYFLLNHKNPYNTFLKENMYLNYIEPMRKFVAINKLYSDVLLSERNTLRKIYGIDNIDIIEDILNIIETYELRNYNKVVIENLIHFKRTIIDMNPDDKKQKIEIYVVCRFANSSIIAKTTNIEEAKRICADNHGSMVIDSKGNRLYGTKDVERKLNKNIQDINYIKGIDIGTIVNVQKANLYETSKSNKPTRNISGSYKIASNKINGRYKLANIKDISLTYGYVNIKEIEKINS